MHVFIQSMYYMYVGTHVHTYLQQYFAIGVQFLILHDQNIIHAHINTITFTYT